MHNEYAMLGADEASSESYWNQIKDSLKDLLNLPVMIQKRRYELAKIAGLAYQKGKMAEMQAAIDSLKRINAMADPAHTISQKIRSYLPKWTAANEETAPMSGLGFWLAATMGVAAVAALAYVATYGLALLSEYKSESVIIEDLKAKTLTIEEAKALIKATKSVGAMTALTEQFGGNLAYTLIPVLLAGGAVLAWKFGLFSRRSA